MSKMKQTSNKNPVPTEIKTEQQQKLFTQKNPPPRVRKEPGGPSLTQQHFKDECDINSIMDRYIRTGTVPTNKGQPKYGDFTTVEDFATSKLRIAEAEQDFQDLHSSIRAKFGNKFENLVHFLEDPKNRPEAEKLGIVEPKKPNKPETTKPAKQAEKPPLADPPPSNKEKEVEKHI